MAQERKSSQGKIGQTERLATLIDTLSIALLSESEVRLRIELARNFLSQNKAPLIKTGFASRFISGTNWLYRYFPPVYPTGPIDRIRWLNPAHKKRPLQSLMHRFGVETFDAHIRIGSKTRNVGESANYADLKRVRESFLTEALRILDLAQNNGEIEDDLISLLSLTGIPEDSAARKHVTRIETGTSEVITFLSNAEIHVSDRCGGPREALAEFLLDFAPTKSPSQSSNQIREQLGKLYHVNQFGQIFTPDATDLFSLGPRTINKLGILCVLTAKELLDLYNEMARFVPPELASKLKGARSRYEDLLKRGEKHEKMFHVEKPELDFHAEEDFRVIYVGPTHQKFEFNRFQAACFQVLFEDYTTETFELHEQEILSRAIESFDENADYIDEKFDAKKLRFVFRKKITVSNGTMTKRKDCYHDAFGSGKIIESLPKPKGYYRLNPKYFPHSQRE